MCIHTAYSASNTRVQRKQPRLILTYSVHIDQQYSELILFAQFLEPGVNVVWMQGMVSHAVGGGGSKYCGGGGGRGERNLNLLQTKQSCSYTELFSSAPATN